MIEEWGYLLIRLREDPTLEFEPAVFKHKLLDLVEAAKEEERRALSLPLNALFDSFHLEGKITEQHAQDIKNILMQNIN